MATRRYTASQQTTMRDLVNIMRRIGASSLKTETDEDLMNPVKGKGANPTAVIRFVRNARMYRISQNRYPDNNDNLRGIQQRLYHLWKATDPDDSFDITSQEFDKLFDQTFAGYLATPDEMILMLGDGTDPWYVVLGVDATATESQIKAAYRSMARQMHPDTAADEADRLEREIAMSRLNLAYKNAKKARGFE